MIGDDEPPNLYKIEKESDNNSSEEAYKFFTIHYVSDKHPITLSLAELVGEI